LFVYITRDRETEFAIKCSFLEIYKERIRDLLNPKNANLKVRETPSRGVWVDGITEEVRCTTRVCVCVRACVRACVRVSRACACVERALLEH
jgi:hypothetical protein